MLMSFKLAVLVNIALQEGSYFRSQEWCDKQTGKLLVEHNQEDWQNQFFEAVKNLKAIETSEKSNNEAKEQSEQFEPLVQFFKTLKT